MEPSNNINPPNSEQQSLHPPFLSAIIQTLSGHEESLAQRSNTEKAGLYAINPEIVKFPAGASHPELWESKRQTVIPISSSGADGASAKGNNPGYALERYRDLNRLSEDSLREYIQLVKASQNEPGFLEASQLLFRDQYEKALPVAYDLHNKLRTIFEGKSMPFPYYDKSSAMVFAPYEQLKIAIGLAWQEFSPLMLTAHGHEQECMVARLVQVILLGSEAGGFPLPDTPCSFFIQELAEKACEPIVEASQSPEGFLYQHLMSFNGEANSEFSDAQLKAAANAACDAFILDSIVRSGNTYSCGFQEPSPASKEALPNSLPNLFNEVNKSYGQYLFENPKAALKLIESNQGSVLFQKLCRIFSRPGPDKELIENLLEDQIKRYRFDEKVYPQLLNIIAQSQFGENRSQWIAERAKCRVDQVNALMACKLVELMVVANQSIEAGACLQLHKQMASFDSSGSIRVSGVKGSNFYFPAADFNSMEITTPIGLVSTEFKLPVGCLDSESTQGEKLIQAIVEARTCIPSIGSKESAEIGIRDLHSPRFHWKASFGLMDFFAIGPQWESASKRDQEEYERVKEGLKKSSDMLKNLTQAFIQGKVPEGFIHYSGSRHAPTPLLAWLKWGGAQKEADPLSDINLLKAQKLYLEECFKKVVSYSEASAKGCQNRKEVQTALLSFRDDLLSLNMVLQDKQLACAQDPEKREAYEEISRTMHYVINAFTPWLPHDTQAPKGSLASEEKKIEPEHQEGSGGAPSQAPSLQFGATLAALSILRDKYLASNTVQYLKTGTSFVYEAAQDFWAGWKSPPAAVSHPSQFKGGTQVNAKATMEIFHELLKGVGADGNLTAFEDKEGQVWIPGQFAKDCCRLTRLSVNGKYIILNDPAPSSSYVKEEGAIAHPVWIYKKLEESLKLSQTQLNYICLVSTQAFAAFPFKKIMEMTNGFFTSPPKQYYEFDRVQKMGRDCIAVTYKTAFPAYDETDMQAPIGFIGYQREVLIPVSELDPAIISAPLDAAAYRAKVTETFTPFCSEHPK